jgi:hypothetical protein
MLPKQKGTGRRQMEYPQGAGHDRTSAGAVVFQIQGSFSKENILIECYKDRKKREHAHPASNILLCALFISHRQSSRPF